MMMNKREFNLLVMAVIIGSAVMGYFDGGDVTATVILSMLLLPAVFDNKKRRKRKCIGDVPRAEVQR